MMNDYDDDYYEIITIMKRNNYEAKLHLGHIRTVRIHFHPSQVPHIRDFQQYTREVDMELDAKSIIVEFTKCKTAW